ncbi:SUMF1/EgtB/PvdO family nonheme iron enzyme [Fervidobacterium gondwanense]|uniref:formylglycine-generating enzyme family protein n=1 Tax=Fervidobacterium gondwanense TaxID=44754 RepID=UPI003C7322B1
MKIFSKTILSLLVILSVLAFPADVLYKDGRVLTGNLLGTEGSHLIVEADIGKVLVPIESVSSIVFNPSAKPFSGYELSVNGKIYKGYATEISTTDATVITWFGKIKLNLSQGVDYIGFEKIQFQSFGGTGLFRMELSTNENYVCILLTGDVFIGTQLAGDENYIILTDASGHTYYILENLIEDLYMPYSKVKGYDMVVLRNNRKIFGNIKVISEGKYEVSGYWGKEVVDINDVIFTTYKETKRPDATDLRNTFYDRNGIATLVVDSPIKVDGKEVRKLNIYPKEILDPRTGIVFVLVPGGSFKMGAKSSWGKVDDDELPEKDVYVSSFYISKYPITIKQYLNFLRAAQNVTTSVLVGRYITPVEIDFLGSKMRAGFTSMSSAYNFPITGINYLSAKAFCEWAGYQLPTEAQWEKAARGIDGRRYPSGSSKPEKYNDGKKDYSVNEFSNSDISPYGVVNMYGLPLEFCRDYYDKDAYKRLSSENPVNLSGQYVVARGGVLSDRITDRIVVSPSEARNDITFRVVIDAENIDKVFSQPLNNKMFGITWFVVNETVKKNYNVKSDGLYVAYVEIDSPAYAAGIKVGDVIVSVEKKNVKNADDVLKIISGKKMGDIISVSVDRNGKILELKLKLGIWNF